MNKMRPLGKRSRSAIWEVLVLFWTTALIPIMASSENILDSALIIVPLLAWPLPLLYKAVQRYQAFTAATQPPKPETPSDWSEEGAYERFRNAWDERTEAFMEHHERMFERGALGLAVIWAFVSVMSVIAVVTGNSLSGRSGVFFVCVIWGVVIYALDRKLRLRHEVPAEAKQRELA
ncbi:hypothetical protein F4X86_02410 [Candidatus Saccharibacteria bacterium]|nr:hypothetical protein [Candidatus Saccharibacteria bacterium]